MFANIPTWTTERVELLKRHFDEGLSCRQIAATIGVSRNAVIGKLTRLGLTRGPTSTEPRVTTAKPVPPDPAPESSTRCCKSSTRTGSRSATGRSKAPSPARCSNSASSDAAGRSARPAPRIFVFAATRRSKACPIAQGTRLATPAVA